jgi:hypothetical protein
MLGSKWYCYLFVGFVSLLPFVEYFSIEIKNLELRLNRGPNTAYAKGLAAFNGREAK